jgi:6-phosphogluconolactonase
MLNKRVEVVIADDLASLSEQAAELVVRCITDRAQVADRVAIVLSGGTTPKGVYERLASENFRHRIPWNRVHLFWGDERCVPPQDPESNYLLAYKTLVSRVPVPPENVHRMPGEKADSEKAADEYEQTLRDFFRSSPGEWPIFDLVLLGIGSDGHTASLFPGLSVLQEKQRWVAAPYVDKLKAYRLTLTPPVFNHARQVIFLAAGQEKAEVIKELQVITPAQERFPFQLIRPDHGKLVFFLDKPAARFIDQKKKS